MRITTVYVVSGFLLIDAQQFTVEELYQSLSGLEAAQLTVSEQEVHAARFAQYMNEKGGDPAEVFRKTMPAVPQSVLESVLQHPDLLWVPVSAGKGRYSGATREDAERECGSVVDSGVRLGFPSVRFESDDPIPDSFDSRTAFAEECSAIIGNVQDQSGCSSCWAVSTTTTLEDRLCIEASRAGLVYNGTVYLSSLDTLSCCTKSQGCISSIGCKGGDPAEAWRWFAEHGVVTGGGYGEASTCKPYSFPPCSQVDTGNGIYSCADDVDFSTPKCKIECTNPDYHNCTYYEDKYKAVLAYSIPSDEDTIKREIMANGPVTAVYVIYEDFLLYSSGIYHHVSGFIEGIHAVKMIGWGEEDGIKYWLIVNSWGTDWGEDGLFRIRLGDSGIMNSITAGTARLGKSAVRYISVSWMKYVLLAVIAKLVLYNLPY